jgi:hypothetical protein
MLSLIFFRRHIDHHYIPGYEDWSISLIPAILVSAEGQIAGFHPYP